MNWLILSVEAVGIVLVADFLSGVVHWVQDRYVSGENSLLDRIVILYAHEHHEDPNKFLKLSWWQRNAFPASMFASLSGALLLFGTYPWQLALLLFVFLFSGEVHRWSHLAKEETGFAIRFLQRIRLIQRAEHHQAHHRGHRGRYCIITNFVNPIVDRLNAFAQFESALHRVFGLQPIHKD